MGATSELLRRIRDRYRGYRDPVGFAKSLGVQIHGEVRFYSISRAMFSTEPWLITIGNNVYITAGVKFVTHDGGTLVLRHLEPTLEWTAPIVLGDNVYVGVDSLILPGVHIGDNVIVGARSVVTKDVPSNSVVAGNPARVVKTTDEYLKAMRAKSLGLGHLKGRAKDRALRRAYLGEPQE